MLREEQETIITFNAAENLMQIYTADPVMMRRCEKLKYNMLSFENYKGEIYSKTFEAPKSFLTLAAKKKTRQLSDEQKQVLSERMKKINAAR